MLSCNGLCSSGPASNCTWIEWPGPSFETNIDGEETAEHKERQVGQTIRARQAEERIWKKYRRWIDGCDEELLVTV